MSPSRTPAAAAGPRPRRLVHPAIGQKILEDRGKQVDRHDHVDILLLAIPHGLLDMERADAEELSVLADQAGAAPERMSGRREQRLLQPILPISREFLLADNPGAQRLRAAASGDDHRIAQLRLARPAKLQ